MLLDEHPAVLAGLRRLPGAFLSQASRSQLPQLRIDQRQQFLSCLWIARFDTLQDAGDVAHR